jgi:DNA invertase Pin-like site-specific DNA recombinase
VSTTEQADSRLGLDAQRDRLEREAESRGWRLEVIADEGFTAKHTRRPGFQSALARLAKGEADVLLAAKVDRVARSTLDFLNAVQTAERQGWRLVVLDMPDLDPDHPFSKVARTIQAAFAELERDLISLRTREAMAQLKANDYWSERLGRRVELGKQVKHSDDTLRRILEDRRAGLSLQAIADALNAEGVPTSQGGRWYSATVKRAAESRRAAKLVTP